MSPYLREWGSDMSLIAVKLVLTITLGMCGLDLSVDSPSSLQLAKTRTSRAQRRNTREASLSRDRQDGEVVD